MMPKIYTGEERVYGPLLEMVQYREPWVVLPTNQEADMVQAGEVTASLCCIPLSSVQAARSQELRVKRGRMDNANPNQL